MSDRTVTIGLGHRVIHELPPRGSGWERGEVEPDPPGSGGEGVLGTAGGVGVLVAAGRGHTCGVDEVELGEQRGQCGGGVAGGVLGGLDQGGAPR